MQKFNLWQQSGYENSTRKSLSKMSAYYTTTKSCMGVMLRQIDADQSHVKSIKNQFFQALFTYLVECFSNTEILTAAQVLEVKLFCSRSASAATWVHAFVTRL